MLKIHNMYKVYSTDEVETVALNGVNLEIAQGDFVAVMGPSGCGKSTLLNIIGMLDNPSDGDYFFFDENIARYNESQRSQIRKQNIGFIFQSFNLIGDLNVYENVELPLTYRGMSASERRERVNAALDLNPECAFSLTIDGLVRNNLLKRPDESQECYDRALEIDPNNALAWLLTGTLNAFVGKGDVAVQQATRALSLSPLDPHLYFFESLAATCHLTAFDFEKALELADRSMISIRRHASTHRVRTIALYGLGRYDEARQSAQELLRIEPGLTVENYLRNHPAALYPTGKYWAKALGESGIVHRDQAVGRGATGGRNNLQRRLVAEVQSIGVMRGLTHGDPPRNDFPF